MASISTKQMLETMKDGQPFTITFVTYDKRRKNKSGKILTLEGILCQKPKEETKVEGRQLTETETKKEDLERLRRNPHHRDHFTRNLQIYVNGHPTAELRKFHPPLVVRFNELKVVA